jgi:NAD(P)-dependent dehydrogenase (short-subunit alcohol dehydrogenase family)
MAPYAATKAGLSQFTRILRRELGGTGVGLTLVELGPVPTDMLDQVNDHAPARAGFHRGYKLRLIVDVPKETVARSIADAIAHDRGSVRLPKRGAAFPVLAATPQAIVDLITRGIPTR